MRILCLQHGIIKVPFDVFLDNKLEQIKSPSSNNYNIP